MVWRMKVFKMKNRILIVFTIIGLISCNKSQTDKCMAETLPFYNEATFTPHWIKPNDKSLDTFHKISDFNLTNQDGNSITQETFTGKIYVADFFFTSCPGICPKMTNNMTMLQEEFYTDDDVMLLSYSVTPEKDSVPVLKQFAISKGISSQKWHLLTGNQEDIYKLGRRDYFVEEDLGLEKDIKDFLHTENFILIDRNRHIRGIYNGINKTSINQLIADIKTLKNEE